MTYKKKPEWIRAKLPSQNTFHELKGIIRSGGHHTVCEEAFCPNHAECWESGTATFLLMGDTCTRGCKFCDVKTGNPHKILDHNEPAILAQSVKKMKLNYVVLTSVDRDDLDDGGADHLSRCINHIRKENPTVKVEILIPDFQGKISSLITILSAKPDVIGHNIETVERLTPNVRDKRASYQQSLSVLENIKKINSRVITKSSIMLGLGETTAEVLKAFDDLRFVDVDILTIGQYLQPSKINLKVVEYIYPEQFDQFKRLALSKGFRYVASGPLVRSSYRAGELFLNEIDRIS
ncbi:lipoyl synthase [Candidatus Hodarchaeum mangrovi]